MFQNKTVVVTGGASGIGKALCMAFASRGAKVVIGDMNEALAREVAQEISGLAVPCNVAKESDVQALIKAAEAQFGPVDIFVSNAGLGRGQPEHAASASTSDWQLNWDVHVMAHVFASRALLPQMIERGSGCLVNVASAAGLLNQIEDAAYSATKHAAVSFAESLAITHKDDGIQVAVVCPQYVATPLLDMTDDTALDGSLISAKDVADAVLKGLEAGDFLILPHEGVKEFYALRGADTGKWLDGMRALRRKFLKVSPERDIRALHKLI